jgi:transcriptional regulator with XRE-family HTH domain
MAPDSTEYHRLAAEFLPPTRETGDPDAGEDDHVAAAGDRPGWPQQDFLAWLDSIKVQLGCRYDSQLAERLGIYQSNISSWRKGKQRPSMETIDAIADALGYEDHRVLWVLAGLVHASRVGLLEEETTPPPRVPSEVERLLEVIWDPDLPDSERERLLWSVETIADGAACRTASEKQAS